MFISEELLISSIKEYGLQLDKEQVVKLDQYALMMVKYNEKVNLTKITDPEGIVIKHFVDSLIMLGMADIPQSSYIADVGTGAGLPGIALMIARPDLKAALFDSTAKKLSFVDNVIGELGLNGVSVNIRAEEAGQGEYREKFDLVTARAVAQLRVLAELCVPLVKKGGVFVSMKGRLSEEEIRFGSAAIKALGGAVPNIKPYELPSGDKRTLLISGKISQSSPNFPRVFAQILKNPL